ncbi:MAG: molybdopterin-dependent oxidoreductase [Desulfobacteraceae bacterium]|jgi:hypothetical protein
MTVQMFLANDRVHDCKEGNVIKIIGRVKQPLLIYREELCTMPLEKIDEIPIYCGTSTPKGCIADCKGVLIENIIRKAQVIIEEDNDTKKMFLVISAADGYTVVFSWQEIFNTPIGGGVMILIEKNGKPLNKDNGGLELISTEDYFTGSRYVKQLQTIEVVIAH